MKIWFGYGSEHSTNLVMIGRFKEARDATLAESSIKHMVDHIALEVESGRLHFGDLSETYSNETMKALTDIGVYDIRPNELEQFGLAVEVSALGNEVRITTDESDVSAFLKVLISRGARVEVYSRHYHEEPADPKPTEQDS